MPEPQVNPAHILQVGFGFWASKTLLSAVELEVFTQLGGESMTGEELGERLALHPRATAMRSTSPAATSPAGAGRSASATSRSCR